MKSMPHRRCFSCFLSWSHLEIGHYVHEPLKRGSSLFADQVLLDELGRFSGAIEGSCSTCFQESCQFFSASCGHTHPVSEHASETTTTTNNQQPTNRNHNHNHNHHKSVFLHSVTVCPCCLSKTSRGRHGKPWRTRWVRCCEAPSPSVAPPRAADGADGLVRSSPPLRLRWGEVRTQPQGGQKTHKAGGRPGVLRGARAGRSRGCRRVVGTLRHILAARSVVKGESESRRKKRRRRKRRRRRRRRSNRCWSRLAGGRGRRRGRSVFLGVPPFLDVFHEPFVPGSPFLCLGVA